MHAVKTRSCSVPLTRCIFGTRAAPGETRKRAAPRPCRLFLSPAATGRRQVVRVRGDCCARGGMRIEKMGRFARRLRPHCAIYYLTCSRPRALADLWANRSLRRRRALEREHLVFRRGDGLVKLRLLPRTHARRHASRQAGTHAALRCHDHTCVAMKGLVSTIESSTGQVR